MVAVGLARIVASNVARTVADVTEARRRATGRGTRASPVGLAPFCVSAAPALRCAVASTRSAGVTDSCDARLLTLAGTGKAMASPEAAFDHDVAMAVASVGPMRTPGSPKTTVPFVSRATSSGSV